MASQPPRCFFLHLPRELRYEVYDYLCGNKPRSYPFGHSPVSSIDHTPPPTALQRTCRYINDEIYAYFYGRRTTLRFVATPGWYPREYTASSIYAIRLARKIDIVLMWNVTPRLAKTYMSKWPKSMHGWLARLVNLLLAEANNLELIFLSVRDSSDEEMGWRVKRRMLAPLRKLPTNVTFTVGEVIASDNEEANLRQRLSHHMKELNARGPSATNYPT